MTASGGPTWISTFWSSAKGRHNLLGPATCLCHDTGVKQEADAPVEEQRVPGGKEDPPDGRVHDRLSIVVGNPPFGLEPLEVCHRGSLGGDGELAISYAKHAAGSVEISIAPVGSQFIQGH